MCDKRPLTSRRPAHDAWLTSRREGHVAKVKFQVGERVIANDKAPGDCRGRVGTVAEHARGRVEYGVRFDGKTAVEYLNSWWLDAAHRRGVTGPP